MGLVLVAVPLLFQVVFVLLAHNVQSQVVREAQWTLHANEILREGQALLTRLVEAQSGTRGLVLTDNPLFAEPYRRASVEVPQRLGELRRLVAHDPDKTARIEAIAELCHDQLDYH